MSSATLSFRFGYANLKHARSANLFFSLTAIEEKFYFGIISEPYCFNNLLVGMPGSYFNFRDDQARAYVAVFNNSLHPIVVFINRDIVCIKCEVNNKENFIIAFYNPGSQDILEALDSLESLASGLLNDTAILCVDTNTKNALWGSNNTDPRGKQTLNFILRKNFDIQNDIDSGPTFSGTTGKSWIDVTLIRNLRDFSVE